MALLSTLKVMTPTSFGDTPEAAGKADASQNRCHDGVHLIADTRRGHGAQGPGSQDNGSRRGAEAGNAVADHFHQAGAHAGQMAAHRG